MRSWESRKFRSGCDKGEYFKDMGDISIEDAGKLNWITGVKGVCVFVIAFLWHYQHFITVDNAPMFGLLVFSYHYGDTLVDLFFCLSGLGIFLGYEEIIRTVSLKHFMTKRIRKLYPPMLMGLLLTTVLEWFYIRHEGKPFVYGNYDIKHFLLNVLGLQSGIFNTDFSFNGPAWTITVFMLLYVLFWVFSHITGDNKHLLILYCLSAAASLAIIVLKVEYPLINSMTARGLMGFSIGVIAAYIYKYHGLADRISSKKLKILRLSGLIIFLATYVMIRQGIGPFDRKGIIRLWVDIILFPILLLLAENDLLIEKILSSRALMFLGRLSLYIYLFHFPVQCSFALYDIYIHEIDFNKITVWLLYITVCILTAYAYEAIKTAGLSLCRFLSSA